MQVEITKSCLSDWAKEVKKKMIDRDMTSKDVADKFKWTSSYVNQLLRGALYSERNVEMISMYFDVPVPSGPEATKAHKETFVVEI